MQASARPAAQGIRCVCVHRCRCTVIRSLDPPCSLRLGRPGESLSGEPSHPAAEQRATVPDHTLISLTRCHG
jgi:hypothetical protein